MEPPNKTIHFNPYTSDGPFYDNSLDRSISNSRVSNYFFLLLCFIEIPDFNAVNVDPDQMPQNATDCYLPGGFLTKMG